MSRVFSVSLLSAAILAPSSFAAESVSWSEPVNGIRIAIAYSAEPAPELRVLLQNTGSIKLPVVLGEKGAITGDASSINLKFHGSTPDGRPTDAMDARVSGVNGVVLPVVIEIEPGAIHEVRIPGQKILFLGWTISLGIALQRGYGIQVSLEVPQELLQSWVRHQELSDISLFWSGRVLSPVLRQPGHE